MAPLNEFSIYFNFITAEMNFHRKTKSNEKARAPETQKSVLWRIILRFILFVSVDRVSWVVGAMIGLNENDWKQLDGHRHIDIDEVHTS